jgi:hypothetical protein
MGRTADRRPDRADEPMPPSGGAADAPIDGSGAERPAGSAPDLRDPTNGSPYLTGESSTTGLGGVGKTTAGGGTGPQFEGGTVPGGTRDRPAAEA